MLPPNRTVRLVAGGAFLLGAVVLFSGLLSLGSPTVTVAVGILDLLVGVGLVVSGARLRTRTRAAEHN